MFGVSDLWSTTYPQAAVGMLAMRGVANPGHHPVLDARKEELEQEMRVSFDGCDRAELRALPALQAYHTYYKRFKKTYHVQLQLESVVLKGKSIPRVAALVECMFMAELKNLLLTAGHDLDALQTPVRAAVARGDERYLRLNGQEQVLKAKDMFIADQQGIMSSVIYGPDQRTQIRKETEAVLFTVYGVPGIGRGALEAHLQDIRDNVLLVCPAAEVAALELLPRA